MKVVILCMAMGALASVGAVTTEAQESLLPATPTQAHQSQVAKESGNSSENPPPATSQVTQNGTPPQSPDGGASTSKKEGNQKTLEEIVVTAQKREERLGDVPIPISVVQGAALVESNKTKLSDFYSEVPGLSIAPSAMGTETLSIRGITTGAVAEGPPDPSPTVGVMIDGVPFGGTGGGDTLVPDFDPGDLARVEVLRGPQGTLYGAASLGGLINYVTVAPSTSSLTGRVEAGTDSVQNGAELGYSFRGSANIPLSDDLAMRVSAFTRQDAGYINNPVLGLKGVNEAHTSGGHFALLWRPSDTFSLQINALVQGINSDGQGAVTPVPPAFLGVAPLGDLQQFLVRGSGASNSVSEAYSMVIKDRIGAVELTALTGYTYYHGVSPTDFSEALYPITYSYFGVNGLVEQDKASNNRFTEELRADVPFGALIDGTFGAYYSNTRDNWDFGPLWGTNPTTGVVAGNFGQIDPDITTYSNYAAFADLTFHVTDRFDVQVGGRESLTEINGQPIVEIGLLPLVLGFPSTPYVVTPQYTLTQHSFTYLFTPKYKISKNFMVYVRLASGFREGGSNAGTPGAGVPGTGVPFAVKPDTTESYEAGAKGQFLDGKLSLDSSLYYIDWKNIQLPLLTPIAGVSYTGNGGEAESEGVELSLQAIPVTGFTLSGWGAYDHAVITRSAVGIDANPGAALPNTPRYSGSVSADEAFSIVDSVTGFVGATFTYVGDRQDAFSSVSYQRQDLPAYEKADIRAGVIYNSWKVNLYCNNVADRRGVISGGLNNAIPYALYLIQPRTVGLSLSKEFE